MHVYIQKNKVIVKEKTHSLMPEFQPPADDRRQIIENIIKILNQLFNEDGMKFRLHEKKRGNQKKEL